MAHQLRTPGTFLAYFLLCITAVFECAAQEVEVETWARHEIDLTNVSYSGNPFEVEVDADFIHRSSGETLRLPGYYSGNDTWTLSFMPTKPGVWDYTTVSADTDLNMKKGTISAMASNQKGMLQADGVNPKKWRFSNGDYVLPISLRVEFFSEPSTEQEFDAAADFMSQNDLLMMETRLTEEYGQFDGRHDFIFAGDWRDHIFDLQVWDRMQQRMDALSQRGLGAHIMFYSDDAGTPGWGAKSETESLVIRYVVARLGSYPVVIFNTGIDISEYRSQSDINWWASEIQRLDSYDHLLSSRRGGGSQSMAASQTFDSRGDFTAQISVILENYQGASVPVSQDDAWGENRGSHASKDHTPADIRRAAWKSIVSGGVGFLLRGGGDGLSKTGFYGIKQIASDLESEQWLRHVNPFILNQLANSFGQMEPVDDIASGTGVYALATSNRSTIVVLQIGPNDTYDNGAQTISLDLRSIEGAWTSSWFDPRSGDDLDNGTIQGGGVASIDLPTADDWVLLLRQEGGAGNQIEPLPPTALNAQ